MAVRSITTVRTDLHENLVWVLVETEDGLVGTGETFFSPGAVEAHVHDVIAPALLGGDETRIGAWHRRFMNHPVGHGASGAETRAASAIDMALWDIAGKSADRPLWRLFGGLAADTVPVYATRAGPRYATTTKNEADIERWFGVDGALDPLDDLGGWRERPAALARELLGEGFAGMKIWPFDEAAYRRRGLGLSAKDIAEGVRPVAMIRDAVGADLDIMVDLHGLLDVESAIRVADALEPFGIAWLEDPIRMDDTDGLADLKAATGIPLLGSETTAGVGAFARLIASRAIDIVSFDVGWSGGFTTCRDVAALARGAGLAIVPHDCTGPIGYAAAATLALCEPNARLMETVRAYTRGWYARVATDLPPIVDGRMRPLPGAGHGGVLRPEFLAAPTTRARASTRQRS